MSESQVDVTEQINEDSKKIEENINDTTIEDEDLEDGEIDDDDDNEQQQVNNMSTAVTQLVSTKLEHEHITKVNTPQVVIDLSDERTISPPPPLLLTSKCKKSQPIEDDHASSIEHALANALKKRGIDPPMPKIEGTTTSMSDISNKEILSADTQVYSRNSRRRKRKKQREDKERDKDRIEKKKRYDSSEALSPADDEDMDDYEMLNVRGGSPPPVTHNQIPYSNYKDNYESAEDSDSSYDSDSADGTVASGSAEQRRRRHAAQQRREPRKRRERNQNQRGEKRSRRDSNVI